MNSDFEEKKKQLKSLLVGQGISYIMKEGYKILGHPFIMFDTSYNLLSRVDDIETDDWIWTEMLTLGTFSHETVDFFNTENFITAFAESDVVSLMKSRKLKYDRMNGKLFDKDGVQLGNISVLACLKPFEDGDMELVEILCEALSVELQNSEFYQRIDRVYQGSMLDDLIDGRVQDTRLVKNGVAGLHKGLKSNLYVAVVDITFYDHSVTHLAYFRDLFRQIQAEYIYYIHMNYIVILISTDNADLCVEADLGKLNEFFYKYRIYAGISSRFQNLLELRKYYREAISALNYGLKSLHHIYRYNNVQAAHFLNSVGDTADTGEISNPVILLIQDYDRESHTSLLEVLYKYLLHGKDTRLTCEALGITPDMLNSRLTMLEDMFEIDWKNGDMLVNLFISIKMLDSLSY